MLNNYDEYVWSKYHRWFVELGYPLLDINRYEDGEWAIIQWLTRPTVPCITEWQNVLSGMRNVEITKGFVEKYIKQIDMERRFFWDREESKSKASEDEWETTENHAEELASAATDAVMRNDDLLRRVKDKGMEELNPLKIARNVPSYQW